MLVKNITETLFNACRIKPNDLVILGFSGGADSVCLLDALSKMKCHFRIAYFNHQLRKTVDREVHFVKNIALKYAVECSIGSEDIFSLAKKNNKGIEETARFYRYQYLIETAKKYNAVSVVVAHHADDQIETILMNLLRGTGLNGLIGMDFVSFSEFSDSIPIIRPMLKIWKSEILEFCKTNNLPFSEDETNSDEIYTRNKIRGQLIPTLQKYNPQIKQSLDRMGTILRDDHEFLLDYAEKAKRNLVLCARKNFIKMDVLEFRKHSVSIQRNIINCLLDEFFFIGKNKSFILIESVRKVLNEEISGNYSKLLVDLQVLVEDNTGYFFSNIQELNKADDLILDNEGDQVKKNGFVLINKNWKITTKTIPFTEVKGMYAVNTNTYVAYVDAASVGGGLSLGKWKEGIRFAPLGLSGHSMKLSDFWINKGFPKRKRGNWPLIMAGNEILWIPGFQPAHSARITDSTREVLKLSVDKV
jgi:tRNA(Ile)-lysidine synthase